MLRQAGGPHGQVISIQEWSWLEDAHLLLLHHPIRNADQRHRLVTSPPQFKGRRILPWAHPRKYCYHIVGSALLLQVLRKVMYMVVWIEAIRFLHLEVSS